MGNIVEEQAYIHAYINKGENPEGRKIEKVISEKHHNGKTGYIEDSTFFLNEHVNDASAGTSLVKTGYFQNGDYFNNNGDKIGVKGDFEVVN